jgi:PAS fold
LAWRFDESIARQLQDFNAIGLNGNDIVELTQEFHVCGFWRGTLEDGLLWWTANIFKIFEMEPHCGPINLQCVFAKIHPEDRSMVFEAFQRSCETRQTFHIIYRLTTNSGSIKWVRSIGKHHTRPDGVPEVRGMLYELFQHVPTAAFVMEPQASHRQTDPS